MNYMMFLDSYTMTEQEVGRYLFVSQKRRGNRDDLGVVFLFFSIET